MRFSTITALCAAPLALAGSLQADLAARGAVEAEKRATSVTVQGVTGGSATEIILIWVNNGGGAATKTITETQTVIGSTTVNTATIATHSVIVGGSAGLVYTPESVVANVGDMVIFEFQSNNHTATQSAFDTPCAALAGGMDTGFMPNVNNTLGIAEKAPRMAMQVAVTTPLWFYCRQAGHCGKGMTFSINPSVNKTQAMFKNKAIEQNGKGTVPPIAGGSAASATTVALATSTGAAAISTGTSMVSGSGTVNSNGACSCSCLCGTAAFPNAAVQGVGAFGGMAGAMPMSALEIVA